MLFDGGPGQPEAPSDLPLWEALQSKEHEDLAGRGLEFGQRLERTVHVISGQQDPFGRHVVGRNGDDRLVVQAPGAASVAPDLIASSIGEQIGRHAEYEGLGVKHLGPIGREHPQKGLLGQILRVGAVTYAIEKVGHQTTPVAPVQGRGPEVDWFGAIKHGHMGTA